MDFLKAEQQARSGHQHLLVVVDRFSKCVELIPVRDVCDAQQVATLYFNHVVVRYGVPEDIVSDRDTKFLSSFWQEIQRLMGTRLSMSTARHPESDGQTERLNSEVLIFLRQALADYGGAWIEHVPLCQLALNSRRNKSIGVAPLEALFGFAPRLPGFLALTSGEEAVMSRVRAVEELAHA